MHRRRTGTDYAICQAVALAVSHPLVNIVRNALSLLVLVVSRPLRSEPRGSGSSFGFAAIKPALDNHPTFLESLVQRLNASDHTLCANALQLVNALMRDAVANGGAHEWPKFIKRLQDLGVIGGVGMLMRGDAAGDVGSPLAAAILEFQGLTKVLLRKWKEVRLNVELPEHKRALKTIHLLSKPEPWFPPSETESNENNDRPRRHHPEKWRRLGFETESPAWEFDETGYLGIMDLVDYTRRNEDAYQKTLMEQAVQPFEQRCPIARASLSVTLLLYEHFEIDDTTDVDDPAYRDSTRVDGRANVDRLYRPLLLQWGRLHSAAMGVFLRMWKVSGAEVEDFFKIEEVVRIIIERIVGSTGRKTEATKVEESLRSVTLETARKWQMDGLDEVYADAWGPHLTQVREQLHHESMQFMKEQRVRCLLQGSWFATGPGGPSSNKPWIFLRLNQNRRQLHYQQYKQMGEAEPHLSELMERIDLSSVTSVDSNVSVADQQQQIMRNGVNSSTGTLTEHTPKASTRVPSTNTKLTIMGSASTRSSEQDEHPLLELYPQSSYSALEWLDGLLLLLNQQPITKDTTTLIDMMVDWGVRLRMLNMRWEDVDWDALEQQVKGMHVDVKEVPSRAGLDNDYWYAMGEA